MIFIIFEDGLGGEDEVLYQLAWKQVFEEKEAMTFFRRKNPLHVLYRAVYGWNYSFFFFKMLKVILLGHHIINPRACSVTQKLGGKVINWMLPYLTKKIKKFERCCWWCKLARCNLQQFQHKRGGEAIKACVCSAAVFFLFMSRPLGRALQ